MYSREFGNPQIIKATWFKVTGKVPDLQLSHWNSSTIPRLRYTQLRSADASVKGSDFGQTCGSTARKQMHKSSHMCFLYMSNLADLSKRKHLEDFSARADSNHFSVLFCAVHGQSNYPARKIAFGWLGCPFLTRDEHTWWFTSAGK